MSSSSRKGPFPCGICSKQFPIRSQLNYHLRTHLEEKPFNCRYCQKGFPTRHQITVHERIHTGEVRFKCALCGKGFARHDHHRKHVLSHTLKVKPHKCSICSAKYKTREDLSIHVRGVHDLENSARHECVFCGGKFLIKRDMEKHILIHIGERPYLCKSCHLDFQTATGLWRHLKYQHPPQVQKFKCDHCPKQYSRKDLLASHIKAGHAPRERKEECQVCGRKFFDLNNLRSHQMTHTKPFSCDLCGKRFASKQTLKPHISQHSTGGRKVFQCDICFSRFNLEKNLTYHRKFRHDPKFASKFVCPFCEKGFPHEHRLSEHLSRHTQENPFFCTLCPGEFRSMGSLRLHRGTHLRQRAKNFKCELCPKLFLTMPNLQKHLRTHTGEKWEECKVCQKRFNCSTARKAHEARHDAMRAPLACELCPRKFAQKDSLHRHMRVHTGEMAYTCRHCNQSFADPSGRWAHVRRHHPHSQL